MCGRYDSDGYDYDPWLPSVELSWEYPVLLVCRSKQQLTAAVEAAEQWQQQLTYVNTERELGHR